MCSYGQRSMCADLLNSYNVLYITSPCCTSTISFFQSLHARSYLPGCLEHCLIRTRWFSLRCCGLWRRRCRWTLCWIWMWSCRWTFCRRWLWGRCCCSRWLWSWRRCWRSGLWWRWRCSCRFCLGRSCSCFRSLRLCLGIPGTCGCTLTSCSIQMITKHRIPCGNVLENHLCHCRWQIHAAMGTIGHIDLPAKGWTPFGIMHTNISIKWHPVADRCPVILAL